MFFVLTERETTTNKVWRISGPFSERSEAERAVVTVLGNPACSSAQVVGVRDLKAVVQTSPHYSERAVTCRKQLDTLRASVSLDYPETATKEAPMPDNILADYLADRNDWREALFR